jgi:hypothetical protein
MMTYAQKQARLALAQTLLDEARPLIGNARSKARLDRLLNLSERILRRHSKPLR